MTLGSIRDLTNDRWAEEALTRLASDKAPPSVAQLVVWHVIDGFDWPTIEAFSRSWTNGYERALAMSFVKTMRASRGPIAAGDMGSIRWELTSRRPEGDKLVKELNEKLKGTSLLGLPLRKGIGATPGGPALALRLRLDEDGIQAQVSASDERGEAWLPVSKLRVAVAEKDGKAIPADEVLDKLAAGVLGRVLDARLVPSKGSKASKPSYTIRIDNVSPLILNGLTLSGPPAAKGASDKPSTLAGFSLPPHRSLTLPISAEAVERLGLQQGVALVAADLSAL